MGKTILLTTHYMEEAQVLADRVVVLAGGRVVAEGTPDSLAAARRRGDRQLPRRRPRRALPHRHADRRPAAAAERGRGPRRGARGADRHPAVARGRLSPAHRGARMTAIAAPRSDARLLGLLDRRPRPDDAALAARARLHVRVPARAGDPVRRDQRGRAGLGRRHGRPVHAVLHARDRRLQPHHRVLHEPGRRPRDRARDRAAQARARHPAARSRSTSARGAPARC